MTTLKGPDAGAYYVEALPSYYLDSEEPKGRWHGGGAAQLGLEGEVVDGQFLRVMAGLYPFGRVGVHLGRAYGDGSVRGFDVTASAPKSVSTLFALGDDTTRAHVLAAHDVAVGVMVDWIEDHAHTRFRIGGEISMVDADGIVVASFRQHTSRALDPQLHSHVVVANRVLSPDGRWLALDARSLKLDQRTVSAIYHTTLRSELTARLGVDWAPVVNGIAEIANVSDRVLEEFSTRAGDVQRRVDVKLDQFVEAFGREPTQRERWRLDREAVIDSRPPKPEAADAAGLHARWAGRVRNLGIDPDKVAHEATEWVRSRDLDTATTEQVMEQAVAALADKQSTWRPAEVTRELAAALPTDIYVEADAMGQRLDRLTKLTIDRHCVDISRPITDGARVRRDGRPVTESVADRALTTPTILAQEERLLAWAERRMADTGADSAAAATRSRVGLTVPQAETAAAVAGTGDLVLVVGPAGTGKTTAMAPAVDQLLAEGRVVFGVAPSAAAAEVLGAETGIGADTVDKLLFEHSRKRPPDHRYNLPSGSTVIVDEAGMVGTDRLDQLAALSDAKGWRVALVGDPMQFSAVGRGGMFNHLIDTHGAIELDQVHRFSHRWEAEASLRLRAGDVSVAEEYERHGRLHGGTGTRMERDALDAWQAARQRGESVVLAAPTNDTVARLNHAAQQRRLNMGDLDARGRTVDAGGYRFFGGDEIVTRRNHRQLHTDRGLMIANRDQWVIDVVHRNGDLTVNGHNGTVRLPDDYVKEHVELGYAQTSHATQGRTVDRSILVLDGPCDVRGLYVPMTRGRHHNDAYIATTGQDTALDVFAASVARSWIDQPALARQAELANHGRCRPGTLPAHELQGLLARQEQLTAALAELRQDLRALPEDLKEFREQQRRVVSDMARDRKRLQRAFDTLEARDRPLRRRGHETAIANAKRAVADLPEAMRRHAAAIKTFDGHIARLERRLDQARVRDQRRPAMTTELTDVSDRLGDDRTIRSRQLRGDTPDRITDTLGNRPRSADHARTWDTAASHLDQHQTAFRLSTGLGPAPRMGLPVGYAHSRTITETAERAYQQGIALERRQSIQRQGPSMGIGR
ncbi:MAG: MobF family relaxase [Acidimicrobiales bacterium]